MKSVLSNKVFLALMMSLTGLFYVVTGIQYWLPDYIQDVLSVDHATATTYFVIASLSAPIGGVIVGGIITSAYGGYNTRKAQKI
jgi:sugar phosphate permease